MPRECHPVFVGGDNRDIAPRRGMADREVREAARHGLKEDHFRCTHEFQGDPTASSRADEVPRVHPKNDDKDGHGSRPLRDGYARRVSTQSVQDEGFVAPSWGR
jgi:hypothetical protein